MFVEEERREVRFWVSGVGRSSIEFFFCVEEFICERFFEKVRVVRGRFCFSVGYEIRIIGIEVWKGGF